MSAQPNPAQAYEELLVPHMFRPFALDLVERAALQPGDRVLDAGCGTGVVARLAAPQVGTSGTVVGLDPSAAMLAVAHERSAAEGVSVAWEEGDATRLAFDEATFDVIVCQQALQFIGDKPAALRELRRVLKPGGRALIATWAPLSTSPIEAALDQVARRQFGVSPMATPFSLGDDDVLAGLVRAAGFSQVTVDRVDLRLRMPSFAHYIRLVVTAAAAVVPSLQALSADERDKIAQVIGDELRPLVQEHLDGDALNMPKSANIARARP